MALNTYYPETVTHPGVILEEALEEKGMGSKEFSVRTGKPEQTISKILQEKGNITPEMAVLFEKVLQIPASFWIESQRRYDECIARHSFEEEVNNPNSLAWARHFPYNEMAKKGWVKDTKKPKERVMELLDYFAVSSFQAWESYYLENKLKVIFRAKIKNNNYAHGLTAWLRHGQIQARQIDAPKYSKNTFRKALIDIKKLVKTQPEDFFSILQTECLKAGVIVIHSPALKGIPVHGATRWYQNTPVIQMTGRYKRNDIFWFTFFHEAGHILKHGKKYISLENIDYEGIDRENEKEADEFSANHLLSRKAEKQLLKQEKITSQIIEEFAQVYSTHPAIVVGRLQHLKIIPFNTSFNKYFVKIEL